MMPKTFHPYALKKLPQDGRDLVFGSLFTPEAILPDSYFTRLPLVIKDQGETDYCSAFSSTSVSEDIEQIVLDPLYQFFKSKTIEGDYASFGCDLRSCAKSYQQFGSIEESQSPYTIETPRTVIVNPSAWSVSLDSIAARRKRPSYVFISEIGDYFENIRQAIYKQEDSAVLGVSWCAEWLGASGGVISSVGTPVSGHAIKIFGWKPINGEPYLIAQLSSGTEYGDKGLFYFSKSVINSQSGYGAFVFTEYEAGVLMTHQDIGVKIDINFIVRWFKLLVNLFKK